MLERAGGSWRTRNRLRDADFPRCDSISDEHGGSRIAIHRTRTAHARALIGRAVPGGPASTVTVVERYVIVSYPQTPQLVADGVRWLAREAKAASAAAILVPEVQSIPNLSAGLVSNSPARIGLCIPWDGVDHSRRPPDAEFLCGTGACGLG